MNKTNSCRCTALKDDGLLLTVQYQMEMMRNLRHVNVDHLHVGWYQSTYYGMYLNKALLDSQFNYQHSIEESIVLIYGEFGVILCSTSKCDLCD